MASRREMSEVRRGAVMQATEELLEANGVASLTIRQVAERAGVAAGTVFLYADNKADLVHQVYGFQIAQRWHRLFDELEPFSPLIRVEKFFLGCVEIFYDDKDNILAYYQAMATDSLTSLDSVESLIERITDSLRLALESGEISPRIDPEVLAYSYQAVYSNVIMLAARGRDRSASSEVVRASIELIRYGIEP
ncbi:TetR family transcriptional regulator [Rathayibacter sp. PhB93]|nr:TetR family transcriptional regulator [Rathayibacter sp. PhB93]TDQ13473.1 TetR family transcriptional regulator [Rathayibacter sp. PhB1]